MSMSKNVAHTSARGVEPYDKCFGVGVHKKLESGGFSPYPRIERIREMYKTSPLFLDSGRALAFTPLMCPRKNLSAPGTIGGSSE